METMFQYIKETPQQCLENIENSLQLTKVIVDEFLKKDYKRIEIVASGSSYNGSLTAKYYMEKLLKMKVEVITSFSAYNYETIFNPDTFYIGMGQSGRSKNTNSALELIRQSGCNTIGVTGNVDSVMKNYCDAICNWGMGIEKIGYVTKGYSTSVLFYMLFALETAYRKMIINQEQYANEKQNLRLMVKAIEDTITAAQKWYADNGNDLYDFKRCQVLGYGPNYAVALEGALKIEETMGKASTAYEMEEFLHGPYIETNGDRAVFVIDSLGKPGERALKMYENLHDLTDKVYLITPREIADPKVLTVKGNLNEFYSPLVNVVAFQTIAANGNAKWVNPLQEIRVKFSEKMDAKVPKTGNEVGL